MNETISLTQKLVRLTYEVKDTPKEDDRPRYWYSEALPAGTRLRKIIKVTTDPYAPRRHFKTIISIAPVSLAYAAALSSDDPCNERFHEILVASAEVDGVEAILTTYPVDPQLIIEALLNRGAITCEDIKDEAKLILETGQSKEFKL